MPDKKIKTALEIAMEKINAMGDVTEEDRLRWKYTPEGEKLAVRFLDNQEEINLTKELEAYDKANVREYVNRAAQKILIGAISLPKTDSAHWRNRRALEGLKILKKDKIAAENIFSQIRALLASELEQGEKQREQAYRSVKAQFEEKVRQMGTQAAGMEQQIEAQFRQEVQRVLAQVDVQYIQTLDEYKKELETIK